MQRKILYSIITAIFATSITFFAASADSLVFINHLAVGSRGVEVQNLQQFLKDQGVYTGPVTGYFGRLTKAGVQNFQTKYSIDPIGEVGPITRGELNALASGSSSSSLEAKIQDLQQQINDLRVQLAAIKNLPSSSGSTAQGLQNEIDALQKKLNILASAPSTAGQQLGNQQTSPLSLPNATPSLSNLNLPDQLQGLQSQAGALQNLQSQITANPNESLQTIQSQADALQQIQQQINAATSQSISSNPSQSTQLQSIQNQINSLQGLENQITANPNMSLQDIQNMMNLLNQTPTLGSGLPSTMQ